MLLCEISCLFVANFLTFLFAAETYTELNCSVRIRQQVRTASVSASAAAWRDEADALTLAVLTYAQTALI